MKKAKSAIVAAGSLVIIGSMAVSGAQAKSVVQTGGESRGGQGMTQGRAGGPNGQGAQGERKGLGVMGKVVSISGTTIAIESLSGGRMGEGAASASGKSYTVDASAAKFKKMSVSADAGSGTETPPARSEAKDIAISDIAVGDTVSVAGKTSGSTITATEITVMPAVNSNDALAGRNIVSGTVQSVSGTTLTVLATGGFGEMGRGSNSNKNVAEKTRTTYTVDAASATVKKVTFSSGSTNTPSKPTETTIAVSDIAVGDGVQIEGTVSGTNIAAKTITDEVGSRNLQAGERPQRAEEALKGNAQANDLKNEVEAAKPGLWTKIVNLFSGLFGKKK